MPGRKRTDSAKTKNHKIIEDAFDMPKILKPSVPHIETEGNREVMIDGCRGILAYEEDLIRLNAGNLVMTFRGDRLSIKTYSESQAVITGDIVSIEFTT